MNSLSTLTKQGLDTLCPQIPMITVGYDTCGLGNGAQEIYNYFINEKNAKPLIIKKVGCIGLCSFEPIVIAYYPGQPMLFFTKVNQQLAKKILENIHDLSTYTHLAKLAKAKIESYDNEFITLTFGKGFPNLPHINELPMLKKQKRIVMRNSGIINPENIYEYIAMGGYSALGKALRSMKPEEIMYEVEQAQLRGRGGSGFLTAEKWKKIATSTVSQKYLICNADEGDPGAYMNRNEIESDPHLVLEGMLITAYAIGAEKCIIYVRSEYTLALQRLTSAIHDAQKLGFLGNSICDTNFSCSFDIVQGAGAFVCGEETALIASIEGLAGRPRMRPPYPVEQGYRDFPTCIHNVETLCNVPFIIAKGASEYKKTGTAASTGTKVFSLVGNVKNTGLVEIPFGMNLNTVIFEMGEGTVGNKKIKAVQTGGPSGGCIPLSEFITSIDYESFNKLGVIMGSGGLVVMDQDNCMVDVARYFTAFNAEESCGRCVSCRDGLSQLLFIYDKIVKGEAQITDLNTLRKLALHIKDTSLCGLGKTSANPILTTLKYFAHEYESHIKEKRCDSGVCENLFEALCENSCPLHMNIPGYLALLLEDRIEDAYELTLRANPFPGSIGRICHFHCQMRCMRESIDESIAQSDIHRYLADTMFKLGSYKTIWNKLIHEKLNANGFSVAIIGAGPAGLTTAYFLARLGYDVTVFESRTKAGGMLRYAIPSFRLPKDILEHELELLKKLGVRFIFNTAIGKSVSLAQIKKQYSAVVIAIGAQKEMLPSISGITLQGVINGLSWLTQFSEGQAYKPKRNCIVLGGGNTAIDVARTLIRLDCKVTVACPHAKSEMTANLQEINFAQEEGVNFLYCYSPHEITGHDNQVKSIKLQEMFPETFDKTGQFPIKQKEKMIEIPCDSVFLCLGEYVDTSYIFNEKTTTNNTIPVDPYTMRVEENVFCVGDAVNGPSTAVQAMGQGKKAAEHIHEFLMNEDNFSQLYGTFAYSKQLPNKIIKSKRIVPRVLFIDDRRNNFQEVILGYSGDQAKSEARRCMRCDVRASTKNLWRNNHHG